MTNEDQEKCGDAPLAIAGAEAPAGKPKYNFEPELNSGRIAVEAFGEKPVGATMAVVQDDAGPEVTEVDLVGGVLRLPSGRFYSVLKGGFDHILIKPYGDPNGKVSRVGIVQVQIEVKSRNWTHYPPSDESFKKLLFTPDELDRRAVLLSAIIYSKLAVAANERLIKSGDHEKYLANTIRKSNAELMRKAKVDISNVYGDPAMIDNLLLQIDRLVARFSTMLPYESLFIHNILDEYDADPTKFMGRKMNV